jgi:hypothetical protein
MATIKQKKAVKKIMENHGNVSKGMIEVGYKPATAKNPKNLTKSKGWVELMESFLDDRLLAEKHRELLEATGIGHMVFPLNVTDDQIVFLLQEANCQAKRFMHSETQTHVWYFAPDNNSRKSALEMAYKLKGHYAPEKHEHLLGRKPNQALDKEEVKRLMGVFKDKENE